MRWRDLDFSTLRMALPEWVNADYLGLSIEVGAEEGAPTAGLQLLCANPFHHAVRYRNDVVLWMAFDNWEDPEYLRGVPLAQTMPAWTFITHRGDSDTKAVWRRMTRETTERALSAGLVSPGRWWLLTCDDVTGEPEKGRDWPGPPWHGPPAWPPAPRPHAPEEVLLYREAWDELRWRDAVRPGRLLPMRPPSEAADGRVKAWRKALRARRCPPVLLWYYPVLERYLVLDGHDRLHAGLLEGAPVPALVMMSMWSQQHAESTAVVPSPELWALLGEKGRFALNDQVRVAEGDAIPYPRMHARQYPGGLKGWTEDVWRRFSALDGVDEAVLYNILRPR